MIKAVIFDCFGVLYGSSMWAQLAVCPPEKRQELLDNSKRNDYGYLSAEEYIDSTAQILGMSRNDLIAMFRERHVRNQPMFDMILTLRKAGLKTALLTNAGRDMPGALFSEEDLRTLFDTFIVSSDYRIVKPNPVIFEQIAEKLGVATGECVMIDDTPENCEGAEVAGMLSVQFITNDATVKSLYKLLQPVID